MRVQDVMTDQVYKVSPDTTAEDAWNLMRMRRIHHLVVTQAGRIVGLLSARDFGGVKGARARKLHTVADVMTPDIPTVTPTTPTRVAADVLRGHPVGCLVVITGGRIVGIVTLADLLEQIGRGRDRPLSTPLRPTRNHRVLLKKRDRADPEAAPRLGRMPA